MKLAIMQPYFFPYIGYFQLLAVVDKFVFYDDVNYIKNGWINRNRLFLAGATRYITAPLVAASPFAKINEIEVQPDEAWRRKMLESVRHSYSRAPYFAPVSELLSQVLYSEDARIAEIAKKSILAVCEYIGVQRELVATSSIYGNASLKGSERVLDICAREGAQEYYNLPGGRELYSDEQFTARGVDLKFIQPRLAEYKQVAEEFLPGLSILDVLMFNSPEAAGAMVREGAAA